MAYIGFEEPRYEREVLRDIDAVLLARQELRQAILQVIEEGDGHIQWGLYHPFPTVAEDQRERFVDAVLARFK